MDVARNLNSEFNEAEYEELDSSSGCEMSFELSTDNLHLSTSPSGNYAPRKLNFDDDIGTPEKKSKFNYSPPYKRVKALRLFDSPLTPKTILHNSSACATPVPRDRRLCSDKPKGIASAYPKHPKPAANVNPFTPNGMFMYFFFLGSCDIFCNLNKIRSLIILTVKNDINF